jgi:hypothetical protein
VSDSVNEVSLQLAQPGVSVSTSRPMVSVSSSGPQGPPGPAGPAGGGPVAAARFEDLRPDPAYGSGGIIPADLNTDSVVGDVSCWAGADPALARYDVHFTVDGWYQVSADGHVFGLNDSDELSLEVILHVTDWFGEVIGFGTAKQTGSEPGGSDVWLSATSPVFYAHTNDYVEMSVNTVDLTSTTSVIERCGINLVRFMNAIDISGGGGASNVITGTGAGLNPVSITKTLPGPGNSVADSDKSIAIGDGANVDVTSLAGIAIGSGAYAFSPDDSAPLAIGSDAGAEGSDTVAIGDSARSAADYGTAIGSSAFAGGVEAVAIGRAQANGAGSIAIGSKDDQRASASNDGDIAIGGDAIAIGSSGTPPLPGDTSAIAIGLNSYANSHSVAVGENTSADVAGVTVGSSNIWSGEPGQTAVGHDLIISAPYSTVVGYRGQSGDVGISSAGAGSVALGAYTKARKDNSIALGRQADANADSAIAIGLSAQGTGESAIAIGGGKPVGSQVSATGDRSMALGVGARALAADTVVIGPKTYGNQARSIVLGSGAQSQAYQGIVIGYNAGGTSTTPQNSVAIGVGAEAGGYRSITIGETGAQVGDRSIALGYGAGSAGPGLLAVADAVAIGTDAYVGAHDGIAIGNVAQGYAQNTVAVGSHTQANDDYAVNVGSCSDGTKGAHGKSSVAIGPDAKTTSTAFSAIALGRASDAEGSGAIAIGAALAMSDQDIAIGTSAQATGGDCVALGSTARATGDSSIAAGGDSWAAELGAITIGGGAQVDSDADYGIALGYGANVRPGCFASIAIGQGTLARGVGAVAIGCDAGGGGATTLNDNDFSLGTVNHKVKVAGRLTVAQRTPSSSADAQGAVGDITSDGSSIYVKTATGWKRATLANFDTGTVDSASLTINAQTGTSYTLVLTDAGKFVTMTNAAASTLTVPPNSAVAFPIGTFIEGAQLGAGQLTITPGSGVTVNATPGLKIAAQFGTFALVKTGTDVWLAFGRLST